VYAERLIGSIRRECLDHVVVFSERHLRHLLLSYMKYYNGVRTHLSLRISGATVGRPPRRRDFHRQYDLNSARCHLIAVSGFTIAKAPRTFGAKQYKPANIRRSSIPNVGRFGDFRRKLVTQNRVFSFKRDPRPSRSDQRQPN
jgi:hypothetical protein